MHSGRLSIVSVPIAISQLVLQPWSNWRGCGTQERGAIRPNSRASACSIAGDLRFPLATRLT